MAQLPNDAKQPYAGEKNLLDPGEVEYQPSRSPSPRRKSNESSPTRSEYEDGTNEVPGTPKEVLHCYNSKSGFNVRIKHEDGICLYYVEHSAFTPKKPDMILHKGSEKTDPTIGVCKWSSMFSKTILIGLGDYTGDESSVAWNEMQTDSRFKTAYQWKIESPDGGIRSFTWKRGHKKDNPDHDSFSTKNFKLTDDATGATVCLFASNRLKSWKKLGKFKIMADYGEKWRLMTLLTCLALIEISRRRSRSRRSGGGGGGGGGGG